MIKCGRVALVAIAGVLAVPCAQAQGGFFVGAQAGRATLSDTGFRDDSSSTQSIGAGYRWQAGASPVLIGVEAGYGRLGEIGESYALSGYSERREFEADYGYVGANARFQFGADSRWFAIARLGYMGYDQEFRYRVEAPGLSEEGRFSDDGGGAYFGLGLGVDVTRTFNVNAMVNGYAYSSIYRDGNRYRFDDDVSTARTVTVGAELRF